MKKPIRSNSNRGDVFMDFLKEIKPIKFREPLAETLGVFKEEDVDLEYSYIDVVKMAGHACPTTAGAYLCCQKALDKLYPNETPVRGEIFVTVYGEEDEGVYGVMAQVFSFLTGAAPASGFRGLRHRFRRKDLLKFSSKKIDPEVMCFEFKRVDNGKVTLVKFCPHKISFPEKKIERLNELLEKVVWRAAKEEEINEFQDLWMEKVKDMLLGKKSNEWIKIEGREYKNE